MSGHDFDIRSLLPFQKGTLFQQGLNFADLESGKSRLVNGQSTVNGSSVAPKEEDEKELARSNDEDEVVRTSDDQNPETNKDDEDQFILQPKASKNTIRRWEYQNGQVLVFNRADPEKVWCSAKVNSSSLKVVDDVSAYSNVDPNDKSFYDKYVVVCQTDNGRNISVILDSQHALQVRMFSSRKRKNTAPTPDAESARFKKLAPDAESARFKKLAADVEEDLERHAKQEEDVSSRAIEVAEFTTRFRDWFLADWSDKLRKVLDNLYTGKDFSNSTLPVAEALCQVDAREIDKLNCLEKYMANRWIAFVFQQTK